MTTYYLWLSLPLLLLIFYPTKEQINKKLRTKETISLQQTKEVKNDTTQLIKNQLTCFIHKKRLSLHRMVKHLYIIAGCNGAGKTTASMTILPKTLLVKEFVNADEIAKGLSPLNPEGAAIEAGRLMLQRIDYLLSKDESFSIETTLATRSYIKLVEKAHQRGFVVNLLFFWLPSPELASIRVTERVRNGGHNIPKDTIYRRYVLGISNLFNLFMNKVDIWSIYDNSIQPKERIAFGGNSIRTRISNEVKFRKIRSYVK